MIVEIVQISTLLEKQKRFILCLYILFILFCFLLLLLFFVIVFLFVSYCKDTKLFHYFAMLF